MHDLKSLYLKTFLKSLFLHNLLTSGAISSNDFLTVEQGESQVEVRAVFINCEPDLMLDASSDLETKRFQREELFKHSALRNCNRKLALTIKLASDIDNFSDDYIPIEHVFEGSNKKRVRLLNPYVLRLRRDQPLQAYKLRKIDSTVDLTNVVKTTESNEETANFNTENLLQNADNHKKLIHNNDLYEKQSKSNELLKVQKWQNNFNRYDNKKCIHNNDSKNKENDDGKDESRKDTKSKTLATDVDTTEKNFNLYEIGNPYLWHQVHVQLFEKIGTADGKTVWNDVTKDPFASVSSISPEWTGRDVFIRYRPTEWISTHEFSLPMRSLYLLNPIYCDNADVYDNEYIVVPVEDVVGLDDDKPLEKRGDNNLISSTTTLLGGYEQGHRKVKIRLSRPLLNGVGDKLRIESDGSDRYLTIPYRRPLHVQIDLEARAEQNQLVLDG
ncbi:hypothetical protein K1T71_003358 [Dendrolimus kikuchii]|uniref:Uncharacterized protein n=1 Tax=Dendrolimus kikuchii TaxID=765133 RepID=A0ACC1DCE3_9NEOP|nr:hypothetical protein K1T71_003358 [Dendrolimus kikuchii]